ncbi:unnamed protein product [Clonostachys byssicola]|uniref:F-box domain-containing protein n=1 Tax=Clonostachys byssicola TaxID=160290 RepID=A0A9N9UZK4_9HYPO|nr:unnamed protein product [Clonostachys byssicola]
MVKTRSMTKGELELSRSWYRLPNEVQDMILETILLDARANKYAANDSASGATSCHNISLMASVCLKWKVFFERNTFKQLVLVHSDLPMFQEVVERSPVRLAYVHYVLLQIQLSEYNCDDCKEEEDQYTINRPERVDMLEDILEDLLKG